LPSSGEYVEFKAELAKDLNDVLKQLN